MAETLTRTIRVTPEHWEQIERVAGKRDVSPNRLVVKLVLEALDRREWPRTEIDSRSQRPRCLPLRSSGAT